MKLTVTKISYPTSDSVTLRFVKVKELERYKPGQHAILTFIIQGQRFRRTYSFHTVNELDDDVAITIRTIPDGKVSNFLRNTAPGDISVELEGIAGDFFVEASENTRRHLIMFGGGSGITPLFPMLRVILLREPQSGISLIYANHSCEKIIFKDELTQLEKQFPGRLKVYHIISEAESIPESFPVFYGGRLSKLIAKKITKDILASIDVSVEFFLCGPLEFMNIAKDAINALYADTYKICQEHFYIPEPGKDSIDFVTLPPRQISLSWRNNDNSFVVQSGESILQAALRNNLRVPYSCTEGQCGTCRSTLVRGEIKLRKNYSLTEEELKAGQILLCQGFPVSDNVVIRINNGQSMSQ
jgi:ring-1,2-phenylacetyl-CoA epoxidase subunit PaaE